MIRLSVCYPTTEGATFDHDYYRDKHVPLVKKTWGVERAEIDKGIDGPYVAAVHLIFESMDAVGAAMGNPGHGRRHGGCRQLHDDHAGAADERDRRLIVPPPARGLTLSYGWEWPHRGSRAACEESRCTSRENASTLPAG